MESADAGVSQDDVAIGVATDDQDFFLGLLMDGGDWFIGRWGWGFVDDEDVLENRSIFKDCEDWDFGLVVFFFIEFLLLILVGHGHWLS